MNEHDSLVSHALNKIKCFWGHRYLIYQRAGTHSLLELICARCGIQKIVKAEQATLCGMEILNYTEPK